MIAALLTMLSTSAAPMSSAGVCHSIANVAQAAAVARRRGVTEAEANAAADELTDGDAHATAHAVIWYVYQANNDGRVPPAKLAILICGACMASTPNALTGVYSHGQ